MASNIRRKHSREFKFKAAMDAIRGEITMAQLMQKYGVHSSQIHAWKRQLLDDGPAIFDGPSSKSKTENESENTDVLLRKIGQLTIERDFLKKVSGN